MVAVEQRPAAVDQQMVMLRCHKCGTPLARVLLKGGSVVEIKCRRCGVKTTEVR